MEPDVNVAFDKTKITDDTIVDMSLSHNRELVTRFARQLVEQCANIASKGSSYVNVTDVIESLLLRVNPSEDDTMSMANAMNIVSDILMSLITCVVEKRTQDAVMFTGQILEAILENICPSVTTYSETYVEIFENVNEFVNNLVTSLFVNATKQIEISN